MTFKNNFVFSISEFPNSIFGEHLRKQVEDRIVFYETGVNPKKNIEIMKLALAEVSIREKDKKKKKRCCRVGN